MTEEQIIERYLSIPYKHLGRTIEGLDCWGLVLMIYRDLGVKIDDFVYDEKIVSEQRAKLYEDYHTRWQTVDRPQFLDVVLLEYSGSPHHAGIVLRYGRFIHMTKLGALINTLGRYRHHIKGFYQLK